MVFKKRLSSIQLYYIKNSVEVHTRKGPMRVTAVCREELSTSVTLWPQLAGTLNAESRKVPGVPITSISNLRHSTERMPDDYGASDS